MASSHLISVLLLVLVAVLAAGFPAESRVGPAKRVPKGVAPPPGGAAKDLEGSESYWGGYGGWGWGGYGGWGYGGWGGWGGWGYGGFGYPYYGGYYGGFYPFYGGYYPYYGWW